MKHEEKIIENLRDFTAKYQYEDQKLSETCLRAADAIEELTDRNVGKWIPVTERLPNEDEITYDGISRKGERGHSDRVLAVNKEGFIRTGYFVGSCMKHPNTSKTFEFGEHYKNDPNEWIVGSSWEPIAWMPLPEPPREVE